jgi:hypothetical protein
MNVDLDMKVMFMLIQQIKKNQNFDASMKNVFQHLVKLDPKMCPHGWDNFTEKENGNELGLDVLLTILYLGYARISDPNVCTMDM